jgi:hypothetical protein
LYKPWKFPELKLDQNGQKNEEKLVSPMASKSTVLRERPCPLLVSHSPTDIPSIPHLKKALEDANVDTKIDALKKVILLMLSGEPATQLLMPIIRFVLTSKDRTIKKLLMLYWEVVDKKAADGKLLHEMILVWYVFCFNHSKIHLLHPILHLLVSFPNLIASGESIGDVAFAKDGTHTPSHISFSFLTMMDYDPFF